MAALIVVRDAILVYAATMRSHGKDLFTELSGIASSGHLRILDAGTGGRRWREVTRRLRDFSCGPITYLERNRARAAAAERHIPQGLDIVEAKIEHFASVAPFDLVYLDVAPRDLPAFFANVLPCALAHLAGNGTLVVNFPVEQLSDQAAAPDAQALAGFSGNFDGGRIETAALTDMVRRAVGDDDPVSICPPHCPVPHFRYQALLCRPRSPGRIVDLQGQSGTHFAMTGLTALLEAFGDAVEFCSSAEFFAALKTGGRGRSGRPAHFIKHDIHRDLLATFRLAKAEAEIGVRGCFMAMHPHKLSEHYVHRAETTEILLAIQALGHEVGVHVDAIDLMRDRSGFMRSLGAFVDHLRGAGLRIECGNTHGNTGYKPFEGYSGNLVFDEMVDLREDRASLIGREGCGILSLETISRELGLTRWLDTVLFEQGRPVLGPRLMLGDNYRRLELYDLGDGSRVTSHTLQAGPNWQIDDTLIETLVGAGSSLPCVHLYHPQFYR